MKSKRKLNSKSNESHLFSEKMFHVYNRDPRARHLRSLPLKEESISHLKEEALSFLKLFQRSSFEKDNLSHVSRLLHFASEFELDFNHLLGIRKIDLELLVLLHDLGKSLVDPALFEFLSDIFDAEDFVNLRVIPHELYSMCWIDKLCNKYGISKENCSLLNDLIANHNLGPPCEDPRFRALTEKKEDGHFSHWWTEHWHLFISRLNESGHAYEDKYGFTEGPLSNSLVFLDRLDATTLHAWEKYLNQDLRAGDFEFSFETLNRLLVQAYENAEEQIQLVGLNLHPFFKSPQPLNLFPPMKQAQQQLENANSVLQAFQKSNQQSFYSEFKVDRNRNLLFKTKENTWLRVFQNSDEEYDCFMWDAGRWEFQQSVDDPVYALFHFLFFGR